ncbi:MAG: AAA family ATPase [Dehalococcoidales bacterium]|nr:AAA family ATPase [Dehalococcoidales bacterium]
MKPDPKVPQIDINEQFKQALDLLENTHKCVFITGRAGTGKSTLLSYFRLITSKKVAVLAPTGVAALNVKGQTVHSFFRFKPGVTLKLVKKLRSGDGGKLIYRKLDAIVIDEISMVRADLLDCVDKFLRLNGPDPEKPFGGIQMIFIGDLYQLPPVITTREREGFASLYKTPYFYSARVFDVLEMEFLELEKIYRQHDPDFINLLNSIRNRSIDEEGLARLNSRYKPGFEPSTGDHYVYLTTTNEMASTVNNFQLNQLDSPLYILKGVIEGDFGKEYLPTAVDLQVKTGAQIMLLNNDADGRWVNGTIGEIDEICPDEDGNQIIVATLPDGIAEITPFTWEIYRFTVDGEALQSEVIGTFTQYPLILAWAITIHKSQGKTFDKVVIDIGSGTFAHGQMYVALSRCTTFNGIILKRRILKNHIRTDYKVVDFLTSFQYQKAELNCSTEEKMDTIRKAIRDNVPLDIVYLKPSDEKTRRTILPRCIGEMEYGGKSYLGLRAFCLNRNDERTFRVDRILEIHEAGR